MLWLIVSCGIKIKKQLTRQSARCVWRNRFGQQFANGMKERFAEDADEVLDKFMVIKQRKKETVDDYADRFHMLLSSCISSGTNIPVVLQLMLFMDGLLPELRMKVRERRPEALSDAISDANYYAWGANLDGRSAGNANQCYFEALNDEQGHGHGIATAYELPEEEEYEAAEPSEQPDSASDDEETTESWPDAYNMTQFEAALFMMATTM